MRPKCPEKAGKAGLDKVLLDPEILEALYGRMNEAVGQLIRKYDANQHHLIGLRESFDRIVSQVSHLEEMVRENRTSVEVTETDFRVEFGSGQIPRNIVDQLAECLVGLRSATDEKNRLEDCLRQAGLDRFIQVGAIYVLSSLNP